MKMTTGYDFQGFFITEYIDVIFDEIMVGLGFGKSLLSAVDNMFSALDGSEATAMVSKLNQVKQELRNRVIRKAENLGANALIGIDFESSKLGDLIMVSMTATAVKIDKIVDNLPLLQSEKEKKEELEKKEKNLKEKQERLEALHHQFDNAALQVADFIEGLKEFETTKDMVEFVEKMAQEKPEIMCIDEELMKKIKDCVRSERIYGKGVGRKTVIQLLQEYFSI